MLNLGRKNAHSTDHKNEYQCQPIPQDRAEWEGHHEKGTGNRSQLIPMEIIF